MNDGDTFKSTVRQLIAPEGFSEDFTLTRIEGGKNNRVYKVHCSAKEALLKAYFKHPSDPRDRCTTEFSFLSFAWNQGIRSIPKPLRFDAAPGLALYEFIHGDRLSEMDVTETAVHEASDFFLKLNSQKLLKEATNLAAASEACFSIITHLLCTERRVHRLVAAADDPTMDAAGREFIQRRLLPLWNKTQAGVEAGCQRLRISETEEIAQENRILSPSDFGFHNALRRASGRLCFVDFEYAGWDDIAKTVCDFYLQPVVPLPAKFFQEFSDTVLQGFEDKEFERERIRVLLPVHRVKWVCIMLNDFLPIGKERRNFSLGMDESQQRRKLQLELAKTALEQAETNRKNAILYT